MLRFVLAAMIILVSINQSFAQKFPDGTVLFVENSSFIVESVTDFNTTHVAVIFDDKVYNAEPPFVKTYKVGDYLKIIAKENDGKAKCKTVFCYPKNPYTKKQIKAMKNYLEGEVGRRYSLTGYVKGIEAEGIHCSQLTTEALMAAGKVKSQRPWRISPGTLRLCVDKFCKTKGCYLIERNPEKTSMISRFNDWLGEKTKFCSWSCYETWSLCR